MSDPMLFCKDIECSGVSSLWAQISKLAKCVSERHVHWRAIVRAKEPHAFLRDLGELQKGDHLEAILASVDGVVSRATSILTHRCLSHGQFPGPAGVLSAVGCAPVRIL